MIDHEPARWKLELVDSIIERIHKSPVIGLVSVSGVPGPQLQSIRAKLRGHLTIQVMKNNLLEIALKRAGEKIEGVDRLAEKVDGQMALMLSDLNPFKLFRLLGETKTRMSAKGGEICPEDIEIRAGETSFKPGPIIGELQKAGIPAAIEQGKVVIKRDKVLVKEGEAISREVAIALTKLEIYPLTVGLELRIAYEQGTIFDSSALDINPEEYYDKIQNAARGAFNLSLFAVIPNRQSILPLLCKAFSEAFNLAISSEYMTAETIKPLMSKASAQSLALASHLPPEALDEDAKAMISRKPAEDEEPKREPEAKEEGEKKVEDKKKDDEKKVSEEEAAAGLGALFG